MLLGAGGAAGLGAGTGAGFLNSGWDEEDACSGPGRFAGSESSTRRKDAFDWGGGTHIGI